MDIQTDFLSQLPAELSLLILSNCSPCGLARCCRVSKVWKTFAEDNFIWKLIARSHFGNLTLKGSYKSYLKNHIVSSKKQICERIQTFANRIRKDQNGRFICSADNYILIDIYIGDGTGRTDIEDHCKMVKNILPNSLSKINSCGKSTIKPLRIRAINSIKYKFKAIPKFPKFDMIEGLFFPKMERKINQILISKIEKFNSQQEWEDKCCRVVPVIVVLFFLVLVLCQH